MGDARDIGTEVERLAKQAEGRLGDSQEDARSWQSDRVRFGKS